MPHVIHTLTRKKEEQEGSRKLLRNDLLDTAA